MSELAEPVRWVGTIMPDAGIEGAAAVVLVIVADVVAACCTMLFLVSLCCVIRRRSVACRARRLAALSAVEPTILVPGLGCRISPASAEEIGVSACLRAVSRSSLELRADAERLELEIGMPVRVATVALGAAYSFLGTVLDCRDAPTGCTIHVSRPAWVQKIQRRAFFRVPVQAANSVSARSRQWPEPRLLGCRIRDMSAGGLRLISPHPLEPGAALSIRVPTAHGVETRFDARVRRCDATRATGREAYEVGCEFDRIDEDTRRRLLDYCFDLERSRCRTT